MQKGQILKLDADRANDIFSYVQSNCQIQKYVYGQIYAQDYKYTCIHTSFGGQCKNSSAGQVSAFWFLKKGLSELKEEDLEE